MRAKDIMSTPVVAVRPDASVREAAAELAAHGFTALPVVDDDGCPVGVVTEADVIRDRIPPDARGLIWRDDDTPAAEPPATVRGLMTHSVTSFAPGADVAEIAKTMLARRIRCVPIVDDGLLVGVVTRRDIMRGIARDDRSIAADVVHRLEIYGGYGRWTVTVHDGRVTVLDEFDNRTDAHVAKVLATGVPGVQHVDIQTSAQNAD